MLSIVPCQVSLFSVLQSSHQDHQKQDAIKVSAVAAHSLSQADSSVSNAVDEPLIKSVVQPSLEPEPAADSSQLSSQAGSPPSQATTQPAFLPHLKRNSEAVQSTLASLQNATTVFKPADQHFNQSPAEMQPSETGLTIAAKPNAIGAALQHVSSIPSRHTSHCEEPTAAVQQQASGLSVGAELSTLGALMSGVPLADTPVMDWDSSPDLFEEFPRTEPSRRSWPLGWLRAILPQQSRVVDIPSRL